jgi:excisionase family DNA binding protein
MAKIQINEKLLTDEEVASFLKVSKNTVKFYRLQGRIEYVRVGKHPRILMSELLRFLDSANINSVEDGQRERSDASSK